MKSTRGSWSRPIQLMNQVFFILILCFACNDPQSNSLNSEAGQSLIIAGIDSQADESVAGKIVNEAESGHVTGGLSGEYEAGELLDGSAGEETSRSSSCGTMRNRFERLVVLSFPYAETLGVDGLTIQLFRFENEQLVPWGNRLLLSAKTSAFSFTKDGWWLIALSESGVLTSIDLRGDIPIIGSTVELVLGDYSIIEPTAEERNFDVINSNSDELSGIYPLRLDCDGSFSLADDFYHLRLVQGYKRAHTSANQAFVFGGQALFEPIDLIDVRWLSSEVNDSSTAWTEISSLDVYEDFIDAINIGVSPFDDWLTVVNGSPFTEEGGQVRFIEVQQNPPSLSEAFFFDGYTDVRGAWYLPQGNSIMITQLEANAVQFFVYDENEWSVGQRIEGIGLANQCAFLSAGEARDEVYALIPSISPSGGGSGVSLLNILDGESVMSLPTISLGEGYINIPKAIATWPLIEHDSSSVER